MSTQVLLDKIAAGTADSVSAIEAEAALAVAAIKESTAAEVATIEADALTAATKAAGAIERATLAKARQAGKLLVQTARRSAFDTVMAAAKQAVVGDDVSKIQSFADKRADLELHLSKQLA